MDIKKLDSFVYFYNQLKGLVKPFYWLYGFVLLIPYFVHYKFFPDDYPTDFLKLGILLLIFIFFGYFILVGSLVVLFYITSNLEKDKENIVLGGMLSIFIIYCIGGGVLAGIWAVFVVSFILISFIYFKKKLIYAFLKKIYSIYRKNGENKKAEKENVKHKNTDNPENKICSFLKTISLLKISFYILLFFILGIFFLFEVGIWSMFSLKKILDPLIVLIFVLILQSVAFYQKRYDFTVAILLLTPVIFVVFFNEIHIHNLEKTFQQLNIASEKSRFYVNERIYKLLTAENSNYLSLCNNKIKIKGKKGCEEYYLVENLYVVWNSSKKIWVKTYKDGRLQIVPIPKKFLINEDIITTYGYKY